MEQKPISIAINDFKRAIEVAIGESLLPPSIVEVILQNYVIQIQDLAKEQLRKDMQKEKEGKEE